MKVYQPTFLFQSFDKNNILPQNNQYAHYLYKSVCILRHDLDFIDKNHDFSEIDSIVVKGETYRRDISGQKAINMIFGSLFIGESDIRMLWMAVYVLKRNQAVTIGRI